MIDADRKEFRKYLLSLEDYYMGEFIRLKDSKPFAAEPEKRMSLLSAHILSEFDAKFKAPKVN